LQAENCDGRRGKGKRLRPWLREATSGGFRGYERDVMSDMPFDYRVGEERGGGWERREGKQKPRRKKNKLYRTTNR
jgi:hypothetical protein